MNKNEIMFVESKPLSSFKNMVIGLPDVGLVGLISVNHIIKSLNAKEIGYVESDIFPPVIVVHNGEPKVPVRFFHNDDTVFLTSEIPIPTSAISKVAKGLLEWIRTKNGSLVVSVSGIAVQNRMDIDVPEVFGVASTKSAKEILDRSKIQPLKEGFMVGPHSQLIKGSMHQKIDNLIIIAQSHYQYPDPGAAASAVQSLNQILDLNVNVQKLLDQAEEIRLKLRETMQRTYKQLQGMQKDQEQELPPMYV